MSTGSKFSRVIGIVAILTVYETSTAVAGTAQNFLDPGTAYALSMCSDFVIEGPQVLPGGPTGGNFLRLIRGADRFGRNGVAFARTDHGGASTVVIDLHFRITPVQGRADGLAVALLHTGIHGTSGDAACLAYEEANILGSLNFGFDTYQNEGDADNNHVSVHFGNTKVAAVSLGANVNLGSGVWTHARIEVRAGVIGGPATVSVTLTPQGGAPFAAITNLPVPGLAPFESRLMVAGRNGGETSDHDVANIKVAYSYDPAVVGQWSAPIPLPVVPIHAALLPTNKMMFFDRTAAGTDPMPRIWDPATSTSVLTQPIDFELFCAGHAFDAQGRLMIFGGHNHADGFGLETAFAYDGASDQYTPLPPMNAGRWYPTNTTLGNGDMLVMSGTITPDQFNDLSQVYDTRSGTFRNLTGAVRTVPYYPMNFLLSDGRVFNAGPNQSAAFLNPTGAGSWTAPIPSRYGDRDYGTAVIYDTDKVALIGGGYTTNSVETIDLKAATPAWSFAAPMNFARRQLNSLLLPDGKVLVTGGSSTPQFNSSVGAVLAAETWDPVSNTWSVGSAQKIPRVYHSESLLLPDGRVISMGGGHPAGIEGENHFDMEIYSPPYLFRGARPVIGSVPDSAVHGQAVQIPTAQAADVAQVNLIRQTSVTHSFNMDQRIVKLPFVRQSGKVVATLPSNPNLAPPGPYLLFIINSKGVPSIARFLSVQSAYRQPSGDGALVTIDLERYHAKVANGGHRWVTNQPGSHTGTGVLQALPNTGTNRQSGYASSSPRVDYWINFRYTGTHHVWLRGRAASSADDTVHLGLDGATGSNMDKVTGFGTNFGWSKNTLDNSAARINVTTAGLHRLSIYMGEDGLSLDKLIIARQASYKPSGNGPAETPQQ